MSARRPPQIVGNIGLRDACYALGWHGRVSCGLEPKDDATQEFDEKWNRVGEGT